MTWSVEQGDCLEILKKMPSDSVDSVVTDPPYFLTNTSGSGFMNQKWDSLSAESAVVEAFLRSMKLDSSTVGGNSSAKVSKGPKQNSSADEYLSTRRLVITRDEALVLSRVLLPSHTTSLLRLPKTARFVVRPLPREFAALSTARIVAAILSAEPEWLEKTTGTNGHTRSVVTTAEQKRFSAITSSHGEFLETIQKITSSPFVSDAIKRCTKSPSCIQTLSEAFHLKWAKECLRVLKPGGHVVAFGGSRTAHRLTSALEEAGLEVRDVLMWVYGQGFPKSLNISKAIDKRLGGTRKVVGDNPNHRASSGVAYKGVYAGGNTGAASITAAGTDEARSAEGLGTALKPSYEPIVLARKPVAGTVVDSFLKYGTGGLNIDSSRVNGRWPANLVLSHHEECSPVGEATVKGDKRTGKSADDKGGFYDVGTEGRSDKPQGKLHGDQEVTHYRCHVDCPVGTMDSQSGVSKPKKPRSGKRGGKGFGFFDDVKSAQQDGYWPGDAGGGASRFFLNVEPEGPRFMYTPKPSKKEKSAGLDDFVTKSAGEMTGGRKEGSAGLKNPRAGAGRTSGSKNPHPTVKSIKLMRWLIGLVTPSGGIVLDPFCGSGSTGCAAVIDGFSFVGLEQSEEYVEVARARIEHWEKENK